MPATEVIPDWARGAATEETVPAWAQPQPLTPEFMASASVAMTRDAAQRQAISAGMQSGTEFLSEVASDPVGAVKAVPQIALGALAAPGQLAYYAAADLASKVPVQDKLASGEVVWSNMLREFGGNLKALKRGETPPVETFLNKVAETNPAWAVVGKVGRDTSALSGLGVVGMLPAGLAKLAAAGFTVDMLRHAPEQFQAYAEEINKPVEQQDAGKIADLRSGIIQTFGFAPLAGAHAAKGVPEGVAREFKYAFDVAEGRTPRGEPARSYSPAERRLIEPAEEGAAVPEGRALPEAKAYQQLREEGLSSWEAEQLLTGARTVEQTIDQAYKRLVRPAWDANASQINGGHAEALQLGYALAKERLGDIVADYRKAGPPVPDWAAAEMRKQAPEAGPAAREDARPTDAEQISPAVEKENTPNIEVPAATSAPSQSIDPVSPTAAVVPSRSVPATQSPAVNVRKGTEMPAEAGVSPAPGQPLPKPAVAKSLTAPEVSTTGRGAAKAAPASSTPKVAKKPTKAEERARFEEEAKNVEAAAAAAPDLNAWTRDMVQRLVDSKDLEKQSSGGYLGKTFVGRAFIEGVNRARTGQVINRGIAAAAKMQEEAHQKLITSMQKPATPEAAVAKVEQHVAAVAKGEKVVQQTPSTPAQAPKAVTGPRPAKEIKSELVQRLEAELEAVPAPEFKESKPVTRNGRREMNISLGDVIIELAEGGKGGWVARRSEISGKTGTRTTNIVGENSAPMDISKAKEWAGAILEKLVFPERAKTVTIEIPGDGTFTIERTHYALKRTLERAQKLNTSSGGKGYTEPERPGFNQEDWFKQAIGNAPRRVARIKPKLVGMGGAIPEEFARSQGTATSIKNATVDAERAARGLPPAMQAARRSFGDVWDEAMAVVDRSPETQDALIAELQQRPRAVTDLEDALLLQRQVDLQNEYAKATRELAAAYDDAKQFPNRLEAVEASKVRVQWASDRLLELYDINKAVGTATARGLAARKMMANEDFTLAKMELELRAAKGGAPLTEAERADLAQLQDKLQRTQQALDDYMAKAEAAKAERRVEERIAELEAELKRRPSYDARIVKIAEEIVGKLEKQADAARLRLKSKFGRTSAGVDPTIVYDLGVIGAAKIARFGLDFTKFSAELVAEFGDEVKEYVQAAWDRANLHLENEGAKYGDKAEPVKRLLRKQDEMGRRENIIAGIKKGAAEGIPASLLGDYVRKLSESFIKGGIRELEPLVDAVHQALRDAGLDLSRREAMDAISGYGQFKALNPNEIKATLRDLRGQMQQVAKLEDILARRPLPKTGIERRTPSDKERRLIQQVNEAMRRIGVVVSDPERQLKSALDAIKTRLEHQIADYEYQINTRERIVKTKTPAPQDAETRLLEVRRDELRRQLDELLPKPGLTDAQRLALAERGVERSIADLEARIAAGDVTPGNRRPPLHGERLDALRARRTALAAELEALRDAADPQRQERAALAAVKARLATSIANYQDRLARGDFSRRQVREVHLDNEALQLKAENEKWRQQYQRRLIEERLKLRSPGRKIYDTGKELLNLPRNILSSWDVSAVLRQGGFITLGRPVTAATSLAPMFRALASENAARVVEQSILTRPNAPRYAQAKLYLAPLESARLSAMEEQIMSRFAHRIPGLRASNRAYITFLNKLRADSFDALVKSIEDRGTPLTPEELQAIGNYVNVATGRGNLYQFTPAAETLATVFFSPRLMASRFQLIAGQPLYHGSARTRAAVAKEYARFLAGMGVVYALASLAGATVETDARSADFGKLRLGNTRADPLGGLSQATVLLSRLATGETKSAAGVVKPIRGAQLPYGADTSADVIARFLRSKLSPVVGAGLDIASGQNLMGEPTTPGSVVKRMAVPLSFQDIYEAMQDQGVPRGTALALLSLFGWGLQVYDSRQRDAATIGGEQMRSLGYGLPPAAREVMRSNLVESLSAQDAAVLNAMAESIRRQRGDTNALQRVMGGR